MKKYYEEILERRRKDYEKSLDEMGMLSQSLMEKDKKELVGMIIGIIMGNGVK